MQHDPLPPDTSEAGPGRFKRRQSMPVMQEFTAVAPICPYHLRFTSFVINLCKVISRAVVRPLPIFCHFVKAAAFWIPAFQVTTALLDPASSVSTTWPTNENLCNQIGAVFCL